MLGMHGLIGSDRRACRVSRTPSWRPRVVMLNPGACRVSGTQRSSTPSCDVKPWRVQGFTDPERFDPDRFNEARKEDSRFKRNLLTFGFGPHACVGREYAINHLVRPVTLPWSPKP